MLARTCRARKVWTHNFQQRITEKRVKVQTGLENSWPNWEVICAFSSHLSRPVSLSVSIHFRLHLARRTTTRHSGTHSFIANTKPSWRAEWESARWKFLRKVKCWATQKCITQSDAEQWCHKLWNRFQSFNFWFNIWPTLLKSRQRLGSAQLFESCPFV